MPVRKPNRLMMMLAVVALGGCASHGKKLMPAPAIAHSPAAQMVSDQVPVERRGSAINLLYITNRAPDTMAKSNTAYGDGRSKSLAFGSAMVELVPQLDWEALRRESLNDPRSIDIKLELGRVRELGRYPNEPYTIVRASSGRLRRDRTVLQRHEGTEQQLQEEIQRRLAIAPTGEVLLFVHGFNETFATAAYTAADLCHFLGRSHVCAMFSWPASARGNPLFS
jgi:esterase/lipase superfamily enzyme